MAQPIPINTSGVDPAPQTVITTTQPAYQAYQILHWGFTILPILAGLDKFAHILTFWEKYLAPIIPQTLHLAPHSFMMIVGVIEIIAGILVAIKPRLFAYVVAVWLWGIIINLLLLQNFYDVALRDFGLSLGALALARLGLEFDRP